MPETYWNGEPCQARRVRVIVADSGRFPHYWAKEHVGKEWPAVEVRYFAEPFYIDDQGGRGWQKVTEGHGSPGWGHRSLEVERVLSEGKDDG